MATTGRIPVSRLDPFADEFCREPYPHHEQLREAGPVVYLDTYEAYAMARHDGVRAALADWQTFVSSAGVGLSDLRSEAPWRKPSLLLEADPPEHSRARGVINRVLSSAVVRALRERFESAAERLVDELCARERIDGIADLAQPYPLRTFSDAVGLPDAGREYLLPYADMVFNAFGPRNARLERSIALAAGAEPAIAALCSRESLEPDGIGAAMYARVEAGDISEAEAGLLVRSLLTAGIDTTVNGLGNALLCLAREPRQWRALHEDPSRASAAFEEALRFESPVQAFFRTTSCAVETDGARIPGGSKVLLFFASANRDPRRWEAAGRFDIARRAAGNVAFGYGIHICVGMMIARLEGEIVLRALARRVRKLELDGEPVLRLNNTLRGWSSLPLRLRGA